MAHVFVADDPSFKHRVVVKVLSPDRTAGVDGERFKREIRVASSLHHPRIVPVLSATGSGDVLYYTMPFIEGDSLRSAINVERNMSVARAVAIARDVAEALVYAHGENIVHRDIKPENIFLDRRDGRALVTDFGIARAVERAAELKSVTTTGLTLGTPIYMSPEQAAAEKHIDGRSDVYSLGCVLYELLTGAPPFAGPTARAIIARHMTEPAPKKPHRASGRVARAGAHARSHARQGAGGTDQRPRGHRFARRKVCPRSGRRGDGAAVRNPRSDDAPLASVAVGTLRNA